MDLRETLKNIRFDRDEVQKYLKSSDKTMTECLELGLLNEKDISWRAVWVFNHALKKQDDRFKKYHQKIMKSLEGKSDGHQREILKSLELLSLTEDEKGQLFDLCMNKWENINHIPSVRHIAFRIMLSLTKDFPELKNEMEFLTDERFLENLSPGIKKSILKQVSQI